MIEIERHIEILLLSNDCVIVPNLGGFMTHHVEACYDEEEAIFLPPQRTLGFNPQLKINDSLLAQSYVEAYDISYPEAIRRIEDEVEELKQHLDNDGYYELNDIGRLNVNSEGKLVFEPCEAGILTPELYGLSSFEMKPTGKNSLAATDKTKGRNKAKDNSTDDATETKANEVFAITHTEESENDEHAITIKMSWVRNSIAVAAAVLAFLFMTKPVSNSETGNVTMSQVNLPIIAKDTNVKTAEKLNTDVLKEALVQHETSEAAPEAAPEATPEQEATAEQAAIPEPELKKVTRYCIVLASQVSQHNAEDFVKRLQKAGYDDARVYINNNIRRVVCGAFETESDAYEQLRQVHKNEALADAWIYKMKE